LKEETLDRTLWHTGFWRGYGYVVCQTTGWIMYVRMRVECVCISMYICMYNQLLLILSVCLLRCFFPHYVINSTTIGKAL
jgi:hypothetical protein